MADAADPYYKPSYDFAGHPGEIAARLMGTDEHKHLRENDIAIGYLMCRAPKRHQGRAIAGSVHMPTVQGRLKDLFEQLLAGYFDGDMPQFLMIIDADWWEMNGPRQREALVWHELSHIRQEEDEFGEPRFTRDGLPKYALREHDVTAFHSEVARYGAWNEDLQKFVEALDGHR